MMPHYSEHPDDQRRRVAVRHDIGEDLLRWAGLVGDDGQPTGTVEAMEHFAEALQNSSIPEACAQIREGINDAEEVSRGDDR